jgi:hypothetical protein
MYPSGDLAQLAARKGFLQARIALRREQSREALVRLTRPVAVVDDWLERWRRVGPMVKIVGIPLALLLARKLVRRMGRGRWVMLARSLPVVVRAARAFAGANGRH